MSSQEILDTYYEGYQKGLTGAKIHECQHSNEKMRDAWINGYFRGKNDRIEFKNQ